MGMAKKLHHEAYKQFYDALLSTCIIVCNMKKGKNNTA